MSVVGRRERRTRWPVVLMALFVLVLAVTGSYTVRPGDTLWEVAARFKVSVQRLAEVNHIRDPDRIRVGQRLEIPGRAVGPRERARVGALIEQVARRYGWSPAFVKAVAWQESGWQQEQVSSTGAIGIMQIQPGTGRFVSRHLARRPLNLRDPEDNVVAGVVFLDYLYDLTRKDARLTLGGYYQGLASIRRHGMYPQTERYIANVLALKRRFR